MTSLVSYYGGKQRIASQIVQLLPPHTVYVEPFAGGAAVLFAKGRPSGNSDHYREVLNDTDHRLITFYRVLQEQPLALCRRIWATPYSEADHARAKTILRTWSEHPPVLQAWAYYVNMQQSFSNRLHGGWGRAVVSCNNAAVWHHQQQRLRMMLTRFAGVHLACTEALTCIQQWDSPQTCFYIDPPYPGANQGHYGGYTTADFQQLVALLETIQGSFVLSNYEQLTVQIPATWERFEIATVSSSSGQGNVRANRSRAVTPEERGDRARTEILWRVDRSSTIRSDLRPIIQQRYYNNQLSLFTKDLPHA